VNYILVRRLFALVLAWSIKSKQWSTFGDLPVGKVNRCATMGRPTIFLIFRKQSGAPRILKLLLIDQLYAWGLRDVVHAYVTPDRLSVAYRWSWSDLIISLLFQRRSIDRTNDLIKYNSIDHSEALIGRVTLTSRRPVGAATTNILYVSGSVWFIDLYQSCSLCRSI